MKRMIPLLLCLLLCACGAEDYYDPQYYTSEQASSATTIRMEEQPVEVPDSSGQERDQLQKTAEEYMRQLYPDLKWERTELTGCSFGDTAYLFVQAYDGDHTVCTIAYQEQDDIYYLYDAEVNQLIPIEYDADGIRLLG